ncbi:MAG: hypothetical protein KIC56_00275 [Clostridium sp.]|nr:hypothetical protein [Clostridium sp.]MEE0768407.1 hypothetical protein [Clostridia bacterium]
MTTQFVEKLIHSKMNVEQNEIIFTFYELRIKHNLTEEQTDEFLALCKTRLENLDYKVFFTGARFTYKEQQKVVQDNELLVAIKE